jgi:hypothetical protein
VEGSSTTNREAAPVIVDPTVPDRPTGEPAPSGRHRIRKGVALPGFGRVLATPDRYKVETILDRHGREVVSPEDELPEGSR